MTDKTLIQRIANKVEYLKRCEGNPQYVIYTDKARENLDRLLKHLPSGSGIDSGTKLDWDRSSEKRVIFTLGFHHMDEHGFYAGWTEHTAIVTPSFDGFDLKITGKDRNQVKEYLYDTYYHALRQPITDEGVVPHVHEPSGA